MTLSTFRPNVRNTEEVRKTLQRIKTEITDGLGSMSTQDSDDVDISGGEIDGTVIGANEAAAGTFTICKATTFDTNVAAAGVTLSGTTLSADGTDAAIDISITPKGTGEVNISKVDIDAGAIDFTVIGGTTPAAGTFTAATVTSEAPSLQFLETGFSNNNGKMQLNSGVLTLYEGNDDFSAVSGRMQWDFVNNLNLSLVDFRIDGSSPKLQWNDTAVSNNNLQIRVAGSVAKFQWSNSAFDAVSSYIEFDFANTNVICYRPLLVGNGSGSGTIKSNGNYDLVIQTGNATTGSITITDGTDGIIYISPNGAGETRIGGASNYCAIEADGSIELNGTATVYDDIFIPMTTTKIPAANAPTWTAFQGNTYEYSFDVNDYVHAPSVEIIHKYKEGSDIEIHCHIVTNGSDVGDTYVRYQVEYTIGDMNEVMSAADTLTSDDFLIPGGTTDRTHMYVNIGTITGTNYKIGATLKMLFKRVALSGGGSAPTSDPFVTMVGAHIEMDTIGSRTETAK